MKFTLNSVVNELVGGLAFTLLVVCLLMVLNQLGQQAPKNPYVQEAIHQGETNIQTVNDASNISGTIEWIVAIVGFILLTVKGVPWLADEIIRMQQGGI